MTGMTATIWTKDIDDSDDQDDGNDDMDDHDDLDDKDDDSGKGSVSSVPVSDDDNQDDDADDFDDGSSNDDRDGYDNIQGRRIMSESSASFYRNAGHVGYDQQRSVPVPVPGSGALISFYKKAGCART